MSPLITSFIRGDRQGRVVLEVTMALTTKSDANLDQMVRNH